MRRKSGEMSLAVIIAAVIGLIVLIVLTVIFLNKTGQFSWGVSSCDSAGGICKEKLADCTASKGIPLATSNSDCRSRNNNQNSVCCKIIKELQ